MSDKFVKMRRGVVLTPQASEPSNPEDGALYYDSDLNRFRKYENGQWSNLGSGDGDGGINHLDEDSARFENGNIGDWVLRANTTPGPIPTPNDTTTPNPGVTFEVSDVDPLRGEWSAILTKDASNRQGHFIELPFTIDRADQNSSQYISFEFKTSANYNTDDLLPFIWDEDASELINLRRSGTSSRFTGRFDTLNSLNYKLILFIASTNAGAYTVQVDSFGVGPEKILDINVGAVGEVLAFAGDVIPDGFLECDGSAVSRAQYSELFGTIGISHGDGDGSTTFNLPDYRGRFLRGVDGGALRDPDAGSRTAMAAGGNAGDAVGSVQGDATARPNTNFTTNNAGAHTHFTIRNVVESSFNNVTTANSVARERSSGSDANNYRLSGTTSVPSTANVGLTNSSGSHSHSITGGGDAETRPINAYVRYIIRYRGKAALLTATELMNETAKFSSVGHNTVNVPTSDSATVVYKTSVLFSDTTGGYDETTGEWTVPTSGYYLASASVAYSLVEGTLAIRILKGTTPFASTRGLETGPALVNNGIPASGIVYAQKGEKISVSVQNDSPSNIALIVDTEASNFSITALPDLSVYAPFLDPEFILNQTYPIGSQYTQYPTANNNDPDVACPISESPAALYGGDWVLLQNGNIATGGAMFFRTEGGIADETNTRGATPPGMPSGLGSPGLQYSQMQRITGQFPAGRTFGLNYGGAFSGTNFGGRVTSGGQENSQGNFNSANSPNARVSSTTTGETRSKNRIFRIWRRIA